MKNIKIFLLYFLLNSITTHSQEETISFLALGDSYTIGTSELAKNNWPNQLTEVLTKKGYKTNTHILAKAGWTTNKLIEEIEKADLNPSYNLVSLLIGVNNQYRGQDIEAFKTDFIVLLKKSIQLAKNDSSNVFVLSIPDWSVTPFARFKDKKRIIKELNDYNDFIERETKKMGVLYIEITQLSRNAGVNRSLIASDSLHPSKKMYKTWTKKISKKVLKELN